MILLFLLLGFVSSVFGQVASSSLLGSVRDESSALVPNVRITVRQESTGFSRAVVTNTDGSYRIDELLPGRYRVTAESPGFKE
jgi:hypothetical protein